MLVYFTSYLHYFWSAYEHCTKWIVLKTNLSHAPAFQDLWKEAWHFKFILLILFVGIKVYTLWWWTMYGLHCRVLGSISKLCSIYIGQFCPFLYSFSYRSLHEKIELYNQSPRLCRLHQEFNSSSKRLIMQHRCLTLKTVYMGKVCVESKGDTLHE